MLKGYTASLPDNISVAPNLLVSHQLRSRWRRQWA